MSTSALKTKMDEEALANAPKPPWTTTEAAVEVLKDAIAGGASGPTTVEGVDETGEVPTGNPVLVGGLDGTNVQPLRVDTGGRTVVVGSLTDGSAIGGAGNPVLVAGSDGTNLQTLATDTNGNAVVTGSVASGATDSGNPVKVGGRYNTTLPTLTNGQRGDVQLDSRSAPYVVLKTADGTNAASVPSAFGDSVSNTLSHLSTGAYNQVFNGTTWDRARGDNTGGAWVQGNAASGATDTGNPVKIGGRYNSTQPTLTNGQRGDAQLDTRGNIKTTLYGADSANAALVGNLGDGAPAGPSIFRLFVASVPSLYNGSTLDTQRANTSTVLLASAARTTTQTSADITNYNARGIHWTIDVTAIAASPSLVPTIQVKDANGIYYTVFTGAAIVGVSTNFYKLYPGITVAANLSVSDILPRTFRLVITAANGDSVTYSSAYSLIL